MQEQRANDILAIQAAIQQDPVYFIDEFTHDTPEDYQADIMRAVFTHKVVSVRSCHDVGKSWLSGKVALAFLSAFIDSYVITTAPTFRQVENILWRGIRGTYNKAKRPIGGHMYQTPRLDFGEEWFAIGLSTKDPDSFQGFHAPSGHILVIVDEAAGVTEDIFIAIDSVLSSEGAHLLMIGNPTSIIGRFHDSHHKDPSAKRFHLSCFDTPNFINNGIRNLDDLIAVDLSKVDVTHPHLITPQWAKDKIRKWGVNSPMFQARVLGNFPTAEANTLIPLNLIELAATEERREELLKSYDGVEQQHFIGVDVARYGDDKSVITERWGGIVEPQIVHGKEDTTQTAGRVKLLKPASSIFIDTDGVGGGVADILIDDRFENIVEVQGAAKPFESDDSMQFVNLRAQIYWNLAERFKTGDIAIPEDEELMSQLASIRYKVTRRGIQIESKDEIKDPKRLGISPDKADSLAYCFADFMEYDSSATPTLGKTYDDMYNESIKD
jgi:phage terminase large subunit